LSALSAPLSAAASPESLLGSSAESPFGSLPESSTVPPWAVLPLFLAPFDFLPLFFPPLPPLPFLFLPDPLLLPPWLPLPV
jgi:hypothetical protein